MSIIIHCQSLSVLVILFVASVECWNFSNSDSADRLLLYGDVPHDTQIASHFPQKCKRIITAMDCGLFTCRILASPGDCVSLFRNMQTIIYGTDPEEDPNCNPDETLCVKVIGRASVSIRGTIAKTPCRVLARRGFPMRWFIWKFLHKRVPTTVFPGITTTTKTTRTSEINGVSTNSTIASEQPTWPIYQSTNEGTTIEWSDGVSTDTETRRPERTVDPGTEDGPFGDTERATEIEEVGGLTTSETDTSDCINESVIL